MGHIIKLTVLFVANQNKQDLCSIEQAYIGFKIL